MKQLKLVKTVIHRNVFMRPCKTGTCSAETINVLYITGYMVLGYSDFVVFSSRTLHI